MEQTNTNVALLLVPEVDDILDLQMANQLLLIKPLDEEQIKTKAGLILTGATGPGGDGITVDLDKTRGGHVQRAVVVSCGPRVGEEIKLGMTVFYYKSALNEMQIRSGNDLYYGIQEYNIKGYLKP